MSKKQRKQSSGKIYLSLKTIGHGVDVKQSVIEPMEPGQDPGLGLFAGNGEDDHGFQIGEPITEYDGERIGRDQAVRLRARGEDTHLKDAFMQHEYIDGLKEKDVTKVIGRGGGSYANDGSSRGMNNAEFDKLYLEKQARTVVYLRAIRPIAKGEEIYVSYANDYWRVDRRTKPVAEAEGDKVQAPPNPHAVHRYVAPGIPRLVIREEKT